MKASGSKDGRPGLVLATYLTGLLIGGLYVGMISPARTVIQADFGIDGTLGIWMINTYTLFYAALIPVIGRIAGRRGHGDGRSRQFHDPREHETQEEHVGNRDHHAHQANWHVGRPCGFRRPHCVRPPGMAGYRNMLLCVASFNAFALAAMMFFRSPK